MLQTAQRLLSARTVPALQLEITRTGNAEQTCATVKMLEQLDALGYELRQASHKLVDKPAPRGPWKSAPSAWDSLPPFPSAEVRARHAQQQQQQQTAGGGSLMRVAYDNDFVTHSTNLVAKLDLSRRPTNPPPWPSLGCL